ncbi:hypothetical protein B0T26DRAFT_343808 [Lasiosphaeria miniovina]|uniref:Uncharacterized protein n=1 Tax=Lasiosphaeria miniovina TaxID=1954250 RepID=A0AA40ABB8_9PEZI|nr:uncharacterized protein B0T26DRAFT_343808 [Lasiosphaeria miniovina]KAK0712696.1 hypothetical protein B0T26DRAFT_343808 [Lasiosphaeria miniovina]
MAQTMDYKKTWILLPNYTTTPGGRFRLGTVVIYPGLQTLSNGLDLPATRLHESQATNFTWDLNSAKRASSIFSKFVSYLSPSVNTEDSAILRCDSLVTQEFYPSNADLKATLKSAEVRQYVLKWPSSTIYMVVGVKIARGASLSSKKTWPDFRGVTHQAFSSSSEFVFAIRLLKFKPTNLKSGDFLAPPISTTEPSTAPHGVIEVPGAQADEQHAAVAIWESGYPSAKSLHVDSVSAFEETNVQEETELIPWNHVHRFSTSTTSTDWSGEGESIFDNEPEEPLATATRIMASNDAAPFNAETYYYGLKAALKLISSTAANGVPQSQPPRDPTDSGFVLKKRLLTIEGSHSIVPIWESDILPAIRNLNVGDHFLSVDCLRIGLGMAAADNPVTILVLAEPNTVSVGEGKSIATQIQDMCRSRGLPDVEVEIAEMMEPHNAGERAGGHGDPHVLDGPFDRNLYLGASIGPPWSNAWGSSGSFGGHVVARQKPPFHDEVIMALTCDHVCFTSERNYLETNLFADRAYKMTKASAHRYAMLAPSDADADATEQYMRERLALADADVIALQGSGDESSIRELEEARDKADRTLQDFLSAKRKVGDVFGTGGSRLDTPTEMPMDWAVVLEDLKLQPSDLNKLPPIQFSGNNNGTVINAIEKAMGFPPIRLRLGRPGPSASLLPGTIPGQISQLRSDPPKHNEVFFKVGRTTGWTAGQYNPCRSMVFNKGSLRHPGRQAPGTATDPSGPWQHSYSDYPWCLYWCFLGVPSDVPFGAKGDSGSLVFDREGQATGLYFSGWNTIPDVSCVISLAAVFRDIETQLDLTGVRLAS